MATYCSDADHIRTLLGVNSTRVADATVTTFLIAASLKLKGWIGTSNYATALAEITTARAALAGGATLESSDTLGALARGARTAEQYLTARAMLPTLNRVISNPGILLTETGDIGTARRFAAPSEIKEMQREMLQSAVDAVGEWIQVHGAGAVKVEPNWNAE